MLDSGNLFSLLVNAATGEERYIDELSEYL